MGKSRYILTLLGSYSGHSLVRFVAPESEAGRAGLEMVCELENLMNGSLRRLTCINRKTIEWIQTDGARNILETIFKNV